MTAARVECGMMIRTPWLIGHPFSKSRRTQGFKLGRQLEHEAVTPVRKFGCPSLFRQRESRGRTSNREGTIIRTVGMIIRTVVFTRTGKLFPLMLLHQNEAHSVTSSNSILTKKGGHPWPRRWDECGRWWRDDDSDTCFGTSSSLAVYKCASGCYLPQLKGSKLNHS